MNNACWEQGADGVEGGMRGWRDARVTGGIDHDVMKRKDFNAGGSKTNSTYMFTGENEVMYSE